MDVAQAAERVLVGPRGVGPAALDREGDAVTGFAELGDQPSYIQCTGIKAFWQSLGILSTCIKKSPELIAYWKKPAH